MRILPIPAIMAFDGNEITDHNRRPVSVSTDKLMNEKRMINGTLRRYIVAEKRKWKVSWEDLFSKSERVVDGFWSAEDMKAFYDETPGEFLLTLTYGDGLVEDVLVMFEEFSYSITKRQVDSDWWDLDIGLVEV